MTTTVTIATAKNAWKILKKANLHHFLDSGALYAINRISELQISLSDLISDLLEGGVLVEFLATVTASDQYIAPDGTKSPWDHVPIPVAAEIIADFFTQFTASFKRLMPS